jgi:hypothetical protein
LTGSAVLTVKLGLAGAGADLGSAAHTGMAKASTKPADIQFGVFIVTLLPEIAPEFNQARPKRWRAGA